MDELISKQAAIEAINLWLYCDKDERMPADVIKALPPVFVPDINVGDMISRQAVIDLLKQMRKDGDMVPWEGKNVFARIRKLPPVQPTITHEQAIDYLHKTGWLQNHDRILTESKVPLKGTWKDFTDEGYVECPFCKSATNCESKEEINDLHFCFSCGAMLKKGEADGHN